MSICKFFSKFGLIYIAFTVQIVRGFLWSQHHRLRLECPPVRKHLPGGSPRSHLLLMHTGDEEYVEDPELSKPRDPLEPSPFALFLTDRQFSIFERKLNEEFKFCEDNMPREQVPVWDINNYKTYMMKAYCMLRSLYTVRGARQTGNGTCDHLIVPNTGDDGCAFIVNYVVSKAEKDLRDDAKACLQKMLDQRFGKELSTRYPPLDDIYKVCIAFCGPKAALEYSKAPV